jgi:hypothetical protein
MLLANLLSVSDTSKKTPAATRLPAATSRQLLFLVSLLTFFALSSRNKKNKTTIDEFFCFPFYF